MLGSSLVFNWVWENFSKDIVKFATEQLKNAWKEVKFEASAEAYVEFVRGEYNFVQIWRMASPVDLEKIFTRVNVLKRPSSLRIIPKEKLEKSFRDESHFGSTVTEEGKNAQEAVEENRRLFILGKPGSGKTTFLKYLTLKMATKKLECLPIFISLKDFSSTEDSLLDFAMKQFQSCNFPDTKSFLHTILKRGESFEITEKSFRKLEGQELPNDILMDLKRLEFKEYSTKKLFLRDLEATIGTDKYKPTILKCSKNNSLKITKKTLEKLYKNGVPKIIVKELKKMQDKKYLIEQEFCDSLDTLIGDEWYDLLFIKHTTIGDIKITNQILKKLRRNLYIPESFLYNLTRLEDKDYKVKEDFFNDINTAIDFNDWYDFISKALAGSFTQNEYFILNKQFFMFAEWLQLPSKATNDLKGKEYSTKIKLLHDVKKKTGIDEKTLTTYVDKEIYYIITRQSLATLKSPAIPDYIFKRIQKIKNVRYKTQEEFLSKIRTITGTKEYLKNLILDAILKHARKAKNFVITAQSLEEFGKQGFPKDIIDKLKILKAKKFLTEKDFIEALKGNLGMKWYEIIKGMIVRYSQDEIFILTDHILTELEKKNVPIKICHKLKELKDQEYESKEQFLEDLESTIGTKKYKAVILKYTRKPKVMLLCDGLDEVNKKGGSRDRIIQELKGFTQKYPETQVIITCRVAASEYIFPNFTYVEMADFNQDQIQEFAYLWFSESENEQTASQFLYELKNNQHKRLHELARNPLLLTLLCIAFEETLNFPNRRSEIYEEALDAMLKKWDTSRRIKRDEIHQKLTLGRKRQMLARIAAETFQDNYFLFERNVLAGKIAEYIQKLPPVTTEIEIGGEEILNEIVAQHGIFVERSKNIYTFSHLTFQEYYTAKYIIEHSHDGALKGLIQNFFNDDSWREVFLLTSEMLDEADTFFNIFVSTLDTYISKYSYALSYIREVRREVKQIKKTGGLQVRFLLDLFKRRPYHNLDDSSEQFFKEQHVQPLNNYLRGTELLIDCLDVAYILDRKKIEARLLNPS